MLQPYYPQRRRRVPSTDPFFDDGNVEWALMVQQQSQQQQHQQGGDTDSQPERPHQPSNWSTQEILCSYSGCNTSFPDPLAYEAHLQAAHRLVCRVCRRVYPTPKMLELHVLENHDTLFKVMAERGEKMYTCFVEGCQRKFLDEGKRRLHLIDLHKYPRSFHFSLASNRPPSQPSKAPSSSSSSSSSGTAATMTEDSMDTSSSESNSSNKVNPYLAHQSQPQQQPQFVPRQVSFGRNKTPAFSSAPGPRAAAPHHRRPQEQPQQQPQQQQYSGESMDG